MRRWWRGKMDENGRLTFWSQPPATLPSFKISHSLPFFMLFVSLCSSFFFFWFLNVVFFRILGFGRFYELLLIVAFWDFWTCSCCFRLIEEKYLIIFSLIFHTVFYVLFAVNKKCLNNFFLDLKKACSWFGLSLKIFWLFSWISKMCVLTVNWFVVIYECWFFLR